MKKIYLTPKHKKFNQTRAEKGLIAKSKELTKGSAFGYFISKKKNVVSHNRTIVIAPEYFSIINNMKEFEEFINKVDIPAWHGKDVYIDLSEVKKITPDGLLIMIAYLNRYNSCIPAPHVGGNCPTEEYCHHVFLESGFYKYVNSNYKHKNSNNVLSVRSDELIRSDEAGAVIEFVRNRLNIKDKVLTRSVYTTIMEAMNNVKEHAYEGRKNFGWWLMALPEKDEDIIHFAIIDNGKGIPGTIRKKLRLSEILPFMENDGKLIQATVIEQNRSSTKLPYRGLGLPKLKKLVDNKKIRNLNIISRKGGYLMDEDKPYNLNGEYFGTMLSWDFTKE